MRHASLKQRMRRTGSECLSLTLYTKYSAIDVMHSSALLLLFQFRQIIEKKNNKKQKSCVCVCSHPKVPNFSFQNWSYVMGSLLCLSEMPT